MKRNELTRSKGFWIGLILVFYTCFGFLIAPVIAKKLLLDYIREDLGREAQLEKVHFNPYALSVTLRGFSMYDEDSETFARFDELYLNFETTSLFRWAWTFKDLRLVSPYVFLEIRKDGTWNFSDLLPTSSSGDPNEEGGSPIRLWIKKLDLDSGRIEFKDLTRPTPFDVSLEPLSVEIKDINTLPEREGPYSLEATTADGETLAWSGTLTLNPVRSSGEIGLANVKARTLWRYIRDKVDFEIRKGAIDVKARYAFSLGEGNIALNLSETDLSLKGFLLGLQGEERELLVLPALRVSGASFDLSQNQLHIPSLSMRAGRVDASRNEESQLDWMRLVPEGGKDEEIGKKEPTQSTTPFRVLIDEVLAEDFSVVFADRTTRPAAALEADAIRLKIGEFSNAPGSEFNLDLSLLFAKLGEVAVKGTVRIDPLQVSASLDVNKIPLLSVQPYLNSMSRLNLDSGRLNVQGNLEYAEQEDGPDMRFSGNASVNALSSRDRLSGDPFMAWDSLSFLEIDAELLPNRLRIGSITTKAPSSKVVIAKDGSVNLIDVLSPEAKEEEDGTQASKSGDTGQGPMPVEIGVVRIENGSVDFKDLSLIPRVSADVKELTGEVRGLSSENLARADVSLKGKVGGYGTVTVAGQINPLSEDAYTDLHVVFRNMELTTVSPYSGKFAGYIIDKGKLSLDLQYKLSKRTLRGENRVVIDKLVFGKETESPDAVKLPVKLAVALLKDTNGVIDVDLPVRGNLDDPEFSLGGIIIKALLNLLMKTVASPFNVLGGLVAADGESMSYVAFSGGSRDLSEEETEKVTLLSKALEQRPSLLLEIRGSYHANHDGRAIQEARLNEKLALFGSASSRPGKEEWERAMEAMFREQFGEDELAALRKGFERPMESDRSDAPSSESEVREEKRSTAKKERDSGTTQFDQAGYHEGLRQRLVQAQPLEKGELRQLAMNRAMAVKDHLVQTGLVDEARIFILEAEPVQTTESNRVRTGMSLTGS